MKLMQWIRSFLGKKKELGYISQQHLAEIHRREGVEGLNEELSQGVRAPQALTTPERKHLWRQE